MLTATILIPLLVAIALLFLPRKWGTVAWFSSFFATLASLICAIIVFIKFNPAVEGFQFVSKTLWVPQLGISFHVGVDGINVGLILMGAIVAFTAACLSWDVRNREKEFAILLLLMSGGILGAFASIDLFFFYFFHELALIPTFIMIGLWGQGEKKNYAAYQITIYLTIGALITLAGLILLYLKSGANSFDLIEISKQVKANRITFSDQNIIFPVLMIGFGILVSLWPFHSWAPLGYATAPTAAAMMHSAVIKKFGLLGLLRVCVPLLPQGAMLWMHILALLCVGSMLYCGWVAMQQKDLNMLLGYSSVAHMGFAFLGIASLSVGGITGAIIIMIAHGLLAALSFGLSGWFSRQVGDSDISKMGGLLQKAPFMGAVLAMAMFAGCGLPGFANFVGEAFVFFGAWKDMTLYVIFGAWGALVIGAIYMLRAIRNILHGQTPQSLQRFRDAQSLWRKIPYSILLSALLFFGLFPGVLTKRIEPSVSTLLKGIEKKELPKAQKLNAPKAQPKQQ